MTSSVSPVPAGDAVRPGLVPPLSTAHHATVKEESPVTFPNLTTVWARAMHAANAAAVELLTEVRPELSVIRTGGESPTHGGNLDVNSGRTVNLTAVGLSARNAVRIVSFLYTAEGDDSFQEVAGITAGVYNLGLDGNQRHSNLQVSADGTLTLDLYGLPLEHACSALAALDAHDESPLDSFLCLPPAMCNCDRGPGPIGEGPASSAAAEPVAPPHPAVPIGAEYRCEECGEPFTVRSEVGFEIAPTLTAADEVQVISVSGSRDDMEVGCFDCDNYPDPDSDAARALRAAADNFLG